MLKNVSLAHNKVFHHSFFFGLVINFGHKLGDIPTGIYQLASLQILDVSNNKIEAIPNDLSRLQNLRIFNMSNNYVSRLPSALYQLGSLLDLDLSGNKISEIHPSIHSFFPLFFGLFFFFDSEYMSSTCLVYSVWRCKRIRFPIFPLRFQDCILLTY